MTPAERTKLVDALRPHLAEYHREPWRYELDFFHSAWCENLHAMGCNMAAHDRHAPVFNDKHVESAVHTALGHWSALDTSWRPPRDLLPSEWDDLIEIARWLGVRGMDERRRYYEGRTWVETVAPPGKS